MTADRDDEGRQSARPLVSLLVVVSGGCGIALQQLATGTPASTARWMMLFIGSFIGGAASILATGLFERLLTWAGFGWSFLRRRTKLRGVVVWVTACALALAIGAVIPPVYEWLHRRLSGCPQPAAVRVLASAEQLDAARALADGYELATAVAQHGCPTADLYVYGASPAAARAAVASAWLDDAPRQLGPRADVWLPDTSLDVTAALAAGARYGVRVPVAEQRVVGYTPVVLAAPRALPGGLNWRQVWAETDRLGLDVVRPDPAVSGTATLATAALYTGPDSAREVEQRLERSLDRGGYPLGTSAELLCHGGTAAVVTSEQAAVRFNEGLGCTGGGRPDQPLLLAYPSDTYTEDRQYVRLAWDDVAPGTAAAAAGFGAWLTGEQGKAALLHEGVRPPGLARVSDPISARFGARDDVVVGQVAPSPQPVETALRLYEQARRPGRVLLALDVSGSMSSTVDRAGTTRLQLASKGVAHALELMSDRDEFGLRVFPADRAGGGWRELVAVGRAPARRRSALDALGKVQPAGGTPLYDTVVGGVRDLTAGAGGPDAPVTSLVVLTDGNDTTGRPPSDVDAQVRGKGVRVFVVAIGEASCGALPLHDVVAHTGGACYDAGHDSLDDVLAELFGLLWGGGTTP